MMKKVWLGGLVAVVLTGMTGWASADHAIGAGANYWRMVDDIKDNPEFDRDGVSYYLSYQFKPVPVFFLEAQLESMPDGFIAGDNSVIAPQVYVGAKILFIYGAAGIGRYYSDGDWSGEMFYVLRAGVDLTLMPFVHLDINANYQFYNMDELDGETTDIGTDTVRLGAAVRMVF
jgi:hypothetical protein